MSNDCAGGSLGDHAPKAYEHCNYTCVYCGFDGRPFDGWMQLTIDHVRPVSSGGSDALDNLVVACRSCNSITSRMQFPPDMGAEEIIRQKRQRVAERRKVFFDEWLITVAPRLLERPLTEFGAGTE